MCCGEHRGGALAPRRYRAAVDFPAVFTVARNEPLHGMGGRLNIGDIEDGQCGGDSCRGGDCVCRSRSPGLGFVTDGGGAHALLRRSVGGVEVGGQDSTPIVSSGRSQDPAGHRANIGHSPDSCRGVVAIDAECGSAGIDDLPDAVLRGDGGVALSQPHSGVSGQVGAAAFGRSTCRVRRGIGAPLPVRHQFGMPDVPAEPVPAG